MEFRVQLLQRVSKALGLSQFWFRLNALSERRPEHLTWMVKKASNKQLSSMEKKKLLFYLGLLPLTVQSSMLRQ
jgi:hypothetical protein